VWIGGAGLWWLRRLPASVLATHLIKKAGF
jgi:hypothetical protein